MPRNTVSATTPADGSVVCWPEPSPLHDWWTEIMDGVTPTRALDPANHPGLLRLSGPRSPRI
ncbi:hypothetical protein [Nocardia sp. NPDC003345]